MEKNFEILEDISGFMYLSFFIARKGLYFIDKFEKNKEKLENEENMEFN